MTTFGLRPDDVVTDTRGNVLDGAAVKLYASQDDASNQINLLGTAYTDAKGRWTFTTDLALVWARTANGLIWRVDSDEEDHGQLAGLLDDDHSQYALADGSRGNFEAAGAVAAHEAGADPHPLYLTQAEADALYAAIGSGGGAAVTDQHIIDVIFDALTQGRAIKVSNPGGDQSLIQLDYWFAPIFWGRWTSLGAYTQGDFTTWNGVLYKALVDSYSEQPDLTPTSWEVVETFGGGGGGSVASTDITDATAVGRSVLTAADAAAARTAIGAIASTDGPASNVQTADYTAVLADAGRVVEFNSATGVALTVPPASSVAWPVGTTIGVYQAGAGNVTVAAGSGVTIRNNAALRGQYAEASLRYRGSDEWVLAGDIATAAAPVLKDYAEVLRTSGDISMTSTTMAAVSTALDLTLAADAGDLVEWDISGWINVASTAAQFDVYTVVGGVATNPFTIGVGGANIGTGGWDRIGAGTFTSVDKTYLGYSRMVGGLTRVLTAGDISGGTVTLRLYYRQGSTTANILFASNPALKMWAKNYGQV